MPQQWCRRPRSPASLPSPPPPLYGESPEDYAARVAAETSERAAQQVAARREAEGALWQSAARIVAVEVIAALRIVKQRPSHRVMEITLRTLAPTRGPAPAARIRLRYDRQFSICGYSGAEYFTAAGLGEVLVLFADAGRLSARSIRDAARAASAAHPATLALLARAKPAL